MDDLFTFFLIFIFFVLPVLERVLKGGKNKRTPPPRPPQQRMPQQRTPERRPRAGPGPQRRPLPESGERAEPRGAEEMVPDDLWAILTGERRPQQPAPPPSRPAPPVEWEGAPVEGVAWQDDTREELAAERLEAEQQLDDLLRRRRREGEARPVAVSLETEPLSEKRRHDRFHRRMDALAPPASIRRKPPVLPSLRDPDQLKQAFVLKEVLGTPKGLE